ncbi:16S rRNA (uracil(1498)-N(3))-methyltransferase [Aurantivibrio plasticivorans]
MRVPRIYFDGTLEADGIIELPDHTAHYLRSVLRLEAGRNLVLFNGQGGEYVSSIAEATKKRVICTVGSFNNVTTDSPLAIQLAIGISKGDRMDWIMQKATELGAKSIQPLFTERTEVKLKADRLEKKLHHWRQIIINACEQSQRTSIPTLNAPLIFSDYLAACETETRLILDPHKAQSLNANAAPTAVALLVGPEGGFSEGEVEQAHSERFMSWCLGPRILRTETAPIAAISVLQDRWGDFQ